MVAVIKTGHSIHRILNYNENKVKEGIAECIGEKNYPIGHDDLSFNMKLNFLQRQLDLNKNVTRNSVHISLNFSPADRELSKDELMRIADDYMEKIGFGNQPYLVYQHHDAGHEHVHIVSIKVRPDGSRIDMNNVGWNESETARKAIEKEFSLVAAEAQKKQQPYRLKPVSASKVLYGKSATKTAIQNVLEVVLQEYKYASLPELNAVLRQYNVMAERGAEDSRVYKNRGLLYRVLDKEGRPIGVPIKASLFYNKHSLKFLEDKFKKNEVKSTVDKSRLRNAIDRALLDKKATLQDLIKALEKRGIDTVLRRNELGVLYGITYVDHQTKCVFNGSALGKKYSANAIQERCISVQDLLTHPAQNTMGLQPQAIATAAETKDAVNLLDTLMQTEQASDYIPYELRGKRKKRRQNKRNNNNL